MSTIEWWLSMNSRGHKWLTSDFFFFFFLFLVCNINKIAWNGGTPPCLKTSEYQHKFEKSKITCQHFMPSVVYMRRWLLSSCFFFLVCSISLILYTQQRRLVAITAHVEPLLKFSFHAFNHVVLVRYPAHRFAIAPLGDKRMKSRRFKRWQLPSSAVLGERFSKSMD